MESEKTQLQAELTKLQNLQIQTKDRLIAAESLLQSRGLIDQYRNCLHESETASSALIEVIVGFFLFFSQQLIEFLIDLDELC